MLDLLRRNASGPFGLTLIILLVLAFSVWGIGDIFRNYDVGTLARIGDREVDSQEFLFRYNREINRISNELERFVSNEEARDSGMPSAVLGKLCVAIFAFFFVDSFSLVGNDMIYIPTFLAELTPPFSLEKCN